ncbi:hypothetical protein Plhal304r1_c080g0166281 [Plasmopara halstedii]
MKNDPEKYKRNPEAQRAAAKRYYQKNREERLRKQKAYDDNYRDELNKKHRDNYTKLKSQDYFFGSILSEYYTLYITPKYFSSKYIARIKMFSHELDGLRKLGIPVKKWGDSYRGKVRGRTGRMVWVSNLSRPYNKEQIVKQHPKAFPRNSSIKDNVNVLKNAVSRPKASYSRMKRRAKEVHTFERMLNEDVFSNLRRTLRSQTKAFKVPIELGYNLINIHTGEKRYYSPGWNTRISDNTIAINKKSEIQSKIFDFMNSTDFASTIK